MLNALRGIAESIRLNTPELLLAVLPLLALLAWQVFLKKRRGAYDLTGLEFLRERQYLTGKWRKTGRALAWSGIVVLLGILWTDPVLYTSEPLFGGEAEALRKNFIVAFDMSPSMNLPVEHRGFGGEDLTAGAAGITRFETARHAFFDFLQRFEGERFGLILFSTEPFLARWPTVETGSQFMEVLGENIRRGSGTQLEAFSSLTNIDKALELAQKVIGGEGGAIIMISDTEDDISNLGAAVRRLRDNGIRLYTIGVGVDEEIVNNLSRQFASDPGFRIFNVASEEEMKEAYRVVGEVEASSLFTRTATNFRTSLRWLLALVVLLAAAIMVWIDQTTFHQSVSIYPGTDTREQG